MAIRRLDSKATFSIISQYDEAVLSETAEELLSEEKDEDGKPKVKQSRYEQYIDSDFDESKLQFKDGQKPDRFKIRALTADELADINGRHVFFDSVAKKVITPNRNKMFLEMFKLTFLGIEDGEKLVKVPLDEIPYAVQVEMGSVASLITTLGKNLKK